MGLDRLAFELKSQSEVYKLVENLNVIITRKPKKHPEYTKTYYAFYFRDPNGIP